MPARAMVEAPARVRMAARDSPCVRAGLQQAGAQGHQQGQGRRQGAARREMQSQKASNARQQSDGSY